MGEEEIEILDLHSDHEADYKEEKQSKKKQKRTVSVAKGKKDYIPAFRSAPYSVLIALLMAGGALNKSELAGKAQLFATTSLTDGMFPALNGALKTLETKGLIGKLSGSLSLTKKGAELAMKVWQSGEQQENQPAPVLDPSKLLEDTEASLDSDLPTPMPVNAIHEFSWEPGSFEIACLVDVREIRSRDDRCYLSDRLTQMGVVNEVRNLELGDFLWIARRKSPGHGQRNENSLFSLTESEELVMPVIIERKREDDLCASITDGRFKEQKHRLRACLVKRPIYLVERPLGSSATSSVIFEAERLMGAAIQCQIGDGLLYRQTAGLEESISFVATVHRRLQFEHQNRELRGCGIPAQHFESSTFRASFEQLQRSNPAPLNLSYTAFSLLNAKSGNQTPTDMLCKQLLCIPGVTFLKARHLLSKPDFCSPQAIHRFYEERAGGGGQAQDALKGEEEGGRKFGGALSRRIYQIFGE